MTLTKKQIIDRLKATYDSLMISDSEFLEKYAFVDPKEFEQSKYAVITGILEGELKQLIEDSENG